MIYRLLVNPGTPQAWTITLRPGVNRIGRAPENDFPVDHPSLSSQHCELIVGDGGVQLRDLGSSSGTFVQGAPVRETWLESGQHLQLGAVDTLFEACPTEASARPASQPAPGATVFIAAFGGSAGTGAAPASAKTESPAAPPETSPAATPTEPSAPRKKSPVHFAAEREAMRRQRFILGLAGALVGSLAGVLIWFALIRAIGGPMLVMAWGVGTLTGWSAARLAKRGGVPLAVAAALCALAGIIAGDALALKAIRTREANRQAVADYRSQLEFAKAALRADAPGEIRSLLAEANHRPAEEVTEEEVWNFQEQQLPHWRDFALGKPSRAEFVNARTREVEAKFNHRHYLFTQDVKSGIFVLLFATLGVATAFRLASTKDRSPVEAAGPSSTTLG